VNETLLKEKGNRGKREGGTPGSICDVLVASSYLYKPTIANRQEMRSMRGALNGFRRILPSIMKCVMLTSSPS
jgi:hypothetical protein